MELISTRDAAQMLGVSPDTVRRWIDAGKLTGYNKIGEGLHLFVDKSQVQKLKKAEGVSQVKPKKK